jgi:hypothetical protein
MTASVTPRSVTPSMASKEERTDTFRCYDLPLRQDKCLSSSNTFANYEKLNTG